MLAMALASIAACQRNETSAPAPVATGAPAIKPPAGATETGAAPAATVPAAGDVPAAAAVDRTPSVDLSLPRTVSIGKSGEVSFTIADATIEPRNTESMRVILLIRMHNKQRQAATFADENFRLLTKDSVIPANGGLSETILAGTDSTLERVQFLVPLGSAPRALKIEHDGEVIEVPLGLK